LVDVSEQVNTDVLRARGGEAEQLGSLARVTAERHGAVRVGTSGELVQLAAILSAFGMHPVGFYDLRDAAPSAIPVARQRPGPGARAGARRHGGAPAPANRSCAGAPVLSAARARRQTRRHPHGAVA